jgi:hypothetical protein
MISPSGLMQLMNSTRRVVAQKVWEREQKNIKRAKQNTRAEIKLLSRSYLYAHVRLACKASIASVCLTYLRRREGVRGYFRTLPRPILSMGYSLASTNLTVV